MVNEWPGVCESWTPNTEDKVIFALTWMLEVYRRQGGSADFVRHVRKSVQEVLLNCVQELVFDGYIGPVAKVVGFTADRL